MINEPIIKITLYETPEEDEAKKLIKSKKFQQSKITFPFWISLLASIGVTIILMNTHFIYPATIDIILLLIIIFIKIYHKIELKEYRQLLKIAQKNDAIRHEERIRFKERQRLIEENETKIATKEKINKTIKKTMPPKPKNFLKNKK